MIFQNKKYFYVFSFLFVISSPLFSEESPKTQDDHMQKIQKCFEQKSAEFQNMIDVVNRDPQGLKYGLGIGLLNGALYKMFQNRSIFKTLHFVLPSAVVSYWVASRNLNYNHLLYDFRQLVKKSEALNFENEKLKQEQLKFNSELVAAAETHERLKIELAGLQERSRLPQEVK